MLIWDFISSRTEGFEILEQILEDYPPEKVAQICHIRQEDLIQAARMYAGARKAPIIYCLGVTEHSTGTEGVMSLSNLAMMTGKLGRPAAASIRCGARTMYRAPAIWDACQQISPATRRLPTRTSSTNSRQRGAWN